MDKKITRRVALGTAIAALAAGPFAIRHIRDKNLIDVDVEVGRSVESLFTSVILPETPDISSLAKDFEAVLSLAPLASAQSAVRRVRYKTVASGGMQLVNHGILDNYRKVRMPSQVCYRDVIYRSLAEVGISEREDMVVYDQSVSVEGMPQTTEMSNLFNTRFKVTFDGLVIEPAMQDVALRESTPRYLSDPVGVDSTWGQTLLANSHLNPGGSVEMKFRVLDTYVKDSERYMRVSSDLSYWVYQPTVENDSGSVSSGVDTEDTVRLR